MSQHGVLTTNVYLLLLNLALRLEVFGTVNVHDWLNRPSRITLFINTRNSYGLIKDNIASRGLSRLTRVQLGKASYTSVQCTVHCTVYSAQHTVPTSSHVREVGRFSPLTRDRDAIANNPARARSLGNVLTSHNIYSFAANNIKTWKVYIQSH